MDDNKGSQQWEGPWLRYSGKHFIISREGYTTPDCLFRSHGLTDDVVMMDGSRLWIPRQPGQDVERLDRPAVLLGDLHNHFGHTIIEAMNRMWYLDHMSPRERADTTFILMSTWGGLHDSLIPGLLDLWDIKPEQIMIANRDFLVNELLIPSPAQRPFGGLDIFYSATMEATYQSIRDRYIARHPPSIPSVDRVFLSRRRF